MYSDRAPDLSVIIVTWNVRDVTLACLDSVMEHRDGLAVEVVVVDNGSTDGTLAAIRTRFPAVTVVEAGTNLGFPRANNVGLQRARGRHVLFLNPDTLVGPRTLRACVEALDRDDALGVVGCRLINRDGTLQRECGRRIYRLRHMLTELLYLHMLLPRSSTFGHHLMGDWDHRDDRDVEAVSGAFMMARRDVVDAIGGLPEELFMYHEDQAFCLRAQRRGWRVRLLGSVATVHLGGQSSRQRTDPRFALLEGEYKVRLIREQQGALAAAVARVIFGVRALSRLAAAGIVFVVPGGSRLRARYPRVFDVRTHALQLQWALSRRTAARYDFGSAGHAIAASAQAATPTKATS